MYVNGKCHCGQISLEAEIDPNKVNICHCTDCQTMSGAPYRVTVPSLENTFKLTSGRPSTYLKVAASGAKRVQGFCPNCGTAVYATTELNQKIFGIRLGTLAQKLELAPSKRIWASSSLSWCEDLTKLPACPGQP
jgi:hypothetical protein